jgi:glutamine amidotransferase-like uncharacterized protein
VRTRSWILVAAAVSLGACGGRADAPILLFDGEGTSPNDVAALEAVLRRDGLAYATVSSSALNAMDEAQLLAHRLLIVPGGDFVAIGNGLTPRTAANVRGAVRHGLNYLGVCAGAFVAGSSPYNGLNLTSGVRFGFYDAERRGVRKAVVPITGPGATTLDQYWEDGPQLAGWGAVVATYPDGTPAVVEGAVGRGWVVLTGIHPEAPASWRRGLTFRTPASVDNAYAATLVRAALRGRAVRDSTYEGSHGSRRSAPKRPDLFIGRAPSSPWRSVRNLVRAVLNGATPRAQLARR